MTCVSACIATERSLAPCAAKLADGTTVELVGLRCYGGSVPEGFEADRWQWWTPDGAPLAQPPDKSTTSCSWRDSYLFALRIAGRSGCNCLAVGPCDKDMNPRQARQKGPAFGEQDDLRLFSLRFAGGQKTADVRLCVATGDWTLVQEWPFWEDATPDSAIFGSEAEVVLRCPEQVREDVVAEVTHGLAEDATRLVIFDAEGQQHLSTVWLGGEGAGLVRYVHRFANLRTAGIKRIEFQKRPYDHWIEFRNVSLRPGQQTQPKVEVVDRHGGLVDSPLPRFNASRIDAAVENARGRRVLLCFWDVAQRPSRNCLQRLSSERTTLESKGVIVIPVHVTSPGENPPDAWLAENRIPWLAETLDDARVKVRQIWGARTLPWLILTDSDHIVAAEGVTLDELNQELAGTNDPAPQDTRTTDRLSGDRK